MILKKSKKKVKGEILCFLEREAIGYFWDNLPSTTNKFRPKGLPDIAGVISGSPVFIFIDRSIFVDRITLDQITTRGYLERNGAINLIARDLESFKLHLPLITENCNYDHIFYS